MGSPLVGYSWYFSPHWLVSQFLLQIVRTSIADPFPEMADGCRWENRKPKTAQNWWLRRGFRVDFPINKSRDPCPQSMETMGKSSPTDAPGLVKMPRKNPTGINGATQTQKQLIVFHPREHGLIHQELFDQDQVLSSKMIHD